MTTVARFLLLPCALCQLLGCNSSESSSPAAKTAEQTATRQAAARVAGKRIFFAHQSVGGNIVEGIKEICGGETEVVNVVRTSEPGAFGRPVFAHDQIGENSRPDTKLADFERKMNAGIGERAEVALMKFCYLDITAKTDVEALFRQYEETMARLSVRYPKLTILHVTVPITTIPKGVGASIRGAIKAALGKGAASAFRDNLQRNRYNALLLQRYQGREPVFDLASVEATAPNGTVERFAIEGKYYQAMYPSYSSDGGHLAATGRARVAEGLLRKIAEIR